MEIKHTKGEWRVVHSNSKLRGAGVRSGDSTIVGFIYSKIDADEILANCKLIAQAPNLLTDLKDALSLLMKVNDVIPNELQETYGNLLINASVTIQKATE